MKPYFTGKEKVGVILGRVENAVGDVLKLRTGLFSKSFPNNWYEDEELKDRLDILRQVLLSANRQLHASLSNAYRGENRQNQNLRDLIDFIPQLHVPHKKIAHLDLGPQHNRTGDGMSKNRSPQDISGKELNRILTSIEDICTSMFRLYEKVKEQGIDIK